MNAVVKRVSPGNGRAVALTDKRRGFLPNPRNQSKCRKYVVTSSSHACNDSRQLHLLEWCFQDNKSRQARDEIESRDCYASGVD